MEKVMTNYIQYNWQRKILIFNFTLLVMRELNMGRYLPLLKRLMSLDITSADSNVERRTKESQHETGTTKLFV